MPSPSRAAEISATRIRRARPLLGTVVEISVAAESSDARLHAAIDAAFAAVEHVHALMSYHDPGSDVSRLNRDAAAAEQKVHPHTYQVLEAALRMAASSDGAFDPVVAQWLEAWGYLPESEGRVDSTATWRDVRLSDAGHVRFLRPLRLDLGGIAKGFAVDLAIGALRSAGIENCTVNAGGDLRVAGLAQQVHLRHPADPSRLAHGVILENEALATSAAYFSRKEVQGRRVSALLDARSGRAYLGGCSFSVIAPSCMAADALTKAAIFAPRPTVERVLGEYDARLLVLSESSNQEALP
jgi:thiamine biosynthesis lipoprotein